METLSALAIKKDSVTREMLASELDEMNADSRAYCLMQVIGHLELDKAQGQELFPLWTAWVTARSINNDAYGLRD